ncbi:transcriptional regulator [Agaricicola taiwanensis]|uniref:Transcriptional regulator n=1 Tax=Agaricicola taiwanensis TaxID=591372 RepID=A0A8J2YNT2_9RHOB|nr:LysR family transcriptional regulator [Agaricicola taiwanensis]GGE54985.1 transcriptional regulator [Agaricicola taiwanensis]
MNDLNDYYYFHAVVTHGGFSAAARRITVPKATLSKHVARLEERLQVRLLERSTRSIRLTAVGEQVYEQSLALVASVEAAETAAAQAHGEPQGVIRVGSPQGLIQDLVADLLPTFLKRYPKLRVEMKVINRRLDLVADGVDVALRARTTLDTDQSLIVRTLGTARCLLAASPQLVAALGEEPDIDSLSDIPTLSMAGDGLDESHWDLVHGDTGKTRRITHRPRLFCSNFDVLKRAAEEGIGIALLPARICRPAFAAGELVPVLPEWATPPVTIHAVFTSRKGLHPGVRAWLDFLARELPPMLSPLEAVAAHRAALRASA